MALGILAALKTVGSWAIKTGIAKTAATTFIKSRTESTAHYDDDRVEEAEDKLDQIGMAVIELSQATEQEINHLHDELNTVRKQLDDLAPLRDELNTVRKQLNDLAQQHYAYQQSVKYKLTFVSTLLVVFIFLFFLILFI